MPVPPVTVRDFERRMLQAELPVLVLYSLPLRLLTDADALTLFRKASELADELYWHPIGRVAVVRAAWDGRLDPDLPLFGLYRGGAFPGKILAWEEDPTMPRSAPRMTRVKTCGLLEMDEVLEALDRLLRYGTGHCRAPAALHRCRVGQGVGRSVRPPRHG